MIIATGYAGVASILCCYRILNYRQANLMGTILTRNLPEQYAIREGLQKIRGSRLLRDVTRIVDIEQDISISCVHAVILG